MAISITPRALRYMTYGEHRNRERERATADSAPAVVGLRHHASAAAAPAPTSAPQTASGFTDHAEPVLRGDPTINDDQRADLWDIYHASPNTTELARRLQPMGLHPDLVQQLLSAKNRQAAEPRSHLGRVTDAIKKISTLDPKLVDLAERHPNALKALVEASK